MTTLYEDWLPLDDGKILEFTRHAFQRCREREVSYDRIAHTVMYGIQHPDGKGKMRFTYRAVTVVVRKLTDKTYRVITVWENDATAA